ncbi:hypothetical protein EDEG_03177 [Edhazardia aedis USNM 41457]|uniref:tRNA (adenine(58)-N(1))-methyltransferase catalytic subunit TRM61 n=1 Tax=Edhazardia aedis (strain USNM 41457) TaxID=1003232 RepID=J9D3G8_EDHAE|nr:hypothetical protein EDEG_03177 [Edhazardia aedis USNM 41457]|eukprot:EJW02391.1 hypothetical protein EDEG_03177 [Edhazardia aedis USNM 41457]
MSETKNLIKCEDSVILFQSINKKYILYPNESNNIFNILHKDIIGKEFNTKYKSIFLLKPNPASFIETVKRQTQILFEADISLIIFMLHIKPGFSVLETGSGSGVLTTFLSKTVGKNGTVHTFERNAERFNALKTKFQVQNLFNVKIRNCDIHTEENIPDNLDAIFLDIPDPQLIVGKCFELLKQYGKICVFVPSCDQVIKVKNELKQCFYDIKMFENLKRMYGRSKSNIHSIIPLKDQYSHTGFLIFAEKK